MMAWIPEEVRASFGQATLVQLASGHLHCCALLSDGRVLCWGGNECGQCDVPADLGPCIAVATGFSQTAALTENGLVVCWGRNVLVCWERNVPCRNQVPADLGPCRAIALGHGHIVALTEDGSVRCWGSNGSGQCDVPTDIGRVTAIHAGNMATAARTIDGETRFWGMNCSLPPWDIPVEQVIPLLVRAGRHIDLHAGHRLVNRLPPGRVRAQSWGAALLSDGRVVCWGDNDKGQCEVPADLGPCKAVYVGGDHTVALTEDGRVVCWGDNSNGQCDGPARIQGNCVGISAGYSSTFALDRTGRLHLWGSPRRSQWEDSFVEFDAPDPELVGTMTDEAWLDFASREYRRVDELVFPEHIRALPQFETIRAMRRLAGG